MTSVPESVDLQAAIDGGLLLGDDCVMKVGEVRDRRGELLTEELENLSSSNSNRWSEYSTGRALAHELMPLLGCRIGPIGRDESRAPIWPAGLLGSISHTGSLAVAALARRNRCRSLGVDLERINRVGSRLAGQVLTESEREGSAGGPQALAVAFAAKEAGYKATYPIVQRFIAFKEAEVDIDWETSRFSLRYVGANEECRVMECATGQFLLHGPHVLALAIIE